MPALKDLLKLTHLNPKKTERLGHFLSQYLFEATCPEKKFYHKDLPPAGILESEKVYRALGILKQENETVRKTPNTSSWTDLEIRDGNQGRYSDINPEEIYLEFDGPWPPPICRPGKYWQMILDDSDEVYIWQDRADEFEVEDFEIKETETENNNVILKFHTVENNIIILKKTPHYKNHKAQYDVKIYIELKDKTTNSVRTISTPSESVKIKINKPQV